MSIEKKGFRDFNVEVVTNGFIVKIGCQKLIFKTLIELSEEMKKYWEDPIVIENKYLSNSLRRDESTRVVLSTNSNSSDGQLEAPIEIR